MQFRMHERGLHYYDLEDEDLVFFNTVSGNKESYIKKQIKASQQARGIHASLGYPSVKDYKWLIQSNQIKYFPVKVQEIDVDHNIWGKSVPSCKEKTTRKKPIFVSGNLVQVPEDLVNINKHIYLTSDLLFFNSNPFFLTLIRNI